MDIRTITLVDDTKAPTVIKILVGKAGVPGVKGDKGDPGSGTVDDRIYAYGQVTSNGLDGVTVSVGALALGDYRVFPSWAGNPKGNGALWVIEDDAEFTIYHAGKAFVPVSYLIMRVW